MSTTLQVTADGVFRTRLAQLAADVLRIPVTDIHPAVPFSAMGLDSLGAAELTALIEDELSHELPPAILFEYPTLESLWRFIESRFVGVPTEVSDRDKETSIAGMLSDAILPPDIVPVRSQGRPPDDVLLTGSTGFVGAYLLRSLLRDTPAVVYCLVRPNGTDAGARVRQNLVQYGIWEEHFASRIRCVYGDITQPRLGMAGREFSNTASSIGAIYHAAAAVDWVRPYEDLRAANVFGTRELLRLACTGAPKSFHFLSSLAVCYSTGASEDAQESDDALTNLRGLRLGYAQSKCIAESLVRQAAERGSRVTVARPTLVSGDSASGISNADDLLSRFLLGCIDLGAAPDLDWAMDCVPVDHVADAMVQLARNEVPGGFYHLVNPRVRYWRECVLWMCLRGYPLELIPYRDWTLRLRELTTASHPLYPLRAFFLRTVDEDGITIPELYEEPRRRRTRCDFSRAMLARAGISCPSLDTNLLDRYFDSYTERDLISPVKPATNVRRDTCLSSPLLTAIERSLRCRNSDPTLRITNVELTSMGGDDSIVAELTSWKRGSRPGLRRARLTTESRDRCTSVIDLVLKSKPPDTDAIAVGEQVARLCGRQLGDAYAAWSDQIGLTRGHLRELAIYEIHDPRLRDHVPAPVAVWRDDDQDEWVVALEYVNDAQVTNAWQRTWIPGEIDASLRGLAALHAVWRDCWETLISQSWLAPRRSSTQMAKMLPLWSALAENARPVFSTWAGPELVKAHESLLGVIDQWWRPLEDNLQTLIHNDFNPRNIMLRGQPGETLRLCAYDWELATIGAPQRDLAEFLCFVLDPETAADEAPTWVQRYLGLLEEQTGTTIDPVEWDVGFRAALCDFLIDRLGMYAMIHRFRPQVFSAARRAHVADTSPAFSVAHLMNNFSTNMEPAGPAGTIHLSNLLTYTALLAGCGAAYLAMATHHRAAAGAFMAVAVIADTFDGRFARLFDRNGFQSAFGVQLDSLTDAVTCGFVPIIVLASGSTPATWGGALAWWGGAFLYALAAITRLGYYNLTHDNGPSFVGLPAPFCALVVSTSLLWSPNALAAALVLVCCAVAMVAPVRVPRPRAVGLAVFVGWALVLVVLHGLVS